MLRRLAGLAATDLVRHMIGIHQRPLLAADSIPGNILSVRSSAPALSGVRMPALILPGGAMPWQPNVRDIGARLGIVLPTVRPRSATRRRRR